MLKRLRIKFIALNMATVAIVLTVVFSVICVISYQQSLQSMQTALSSAVAHADSSFLHGQLSEPATPDSPPATSPDTTAPPAQPPEIGGQQGGAGQSIPVAVYCLHGNAFSATAVSLSTATLSDDALVRAASELAALPDGTGKLDDLGLYYDMRSVGNVSYVAFADVSTTSQWQSLALTLAGVELVTLAVFFVISLFFSRWALRPVTHAWNQQRRFVADASHDLKTPLTVILANTSILMEHPERSVASQSQWVESTRSVAKHMQELVEDLLLLAQLDEQTASSSRPAASANAEPELIDLSDLVEGELLEFESVAYERGISLTQDLATGIAVRGDATRLRRLTATLIDNACKYASGTGTVSVTLRACGKQAELTVHNTGTVISPDDLPHVFDRFYRADKARSSESGHGLGLAIARAIAEEHGGTLTAASTEQAGTTFTATLPLAQ